MRGETRLLTELRGVGELREEWQRLSGLRQSQQLIASGDLLRKQRMGAA